MLGLIENNTLIIFDAFKACANHLNIDVTTLYRWSKQADIKYFKEFTVFFNVNYVKNRKRGRYS